MTNTSVDASQSSLVRRLEEVRRLCPNLRFGEFLATVGMLGEDSTGLTIMAVLTGGSAPFAED